MNAVIKSGKVILYYPSQGNGGTKDFQKNTPHKFSDGAQKRFLHCVDNFGSIFESLHTVRKNEFPFRNLYRLMNLKDIATIELKRVKKKADKTHTWMEPRDRKPVFLTLTVPEQGNCDDETIKNECLTPFFENLRKSHNMRNYVWKAEAQLRGDIHFHAVVDCFLDHKKVRKLWHKRLAAHNLTNGIELDKASKIAWMEHVKDIRTIKFELAGYFATKRDKYGRLMYKHYTAQRRNESTDDFWARVQHTPGAKPLCMQCREVLMCGSFEHRDAEGKPIVRDYCSPRPRKENERYNEVYDCDTCREKPMCGRCIIYPIREIEGNSWGRSDSLDYPPPSVTGITYAQEETICRDAISVKEDKVKMPGVQVCVYRDFVKYKDKKTGEQKTWVQENEYTEGLGAINAIWHLRKALEIYHPGKELPKGLEYYITENQSWNVKV